MPARVPGRCGCRSSCALRLFCCSGADSFRFYCLGLTGWVVQLASVFTGWVAQLASAFKGWVAVSFRPYGLGAGAGSYERAAAAALPPHETQSQLSVRQEPTQPTESDWPKQPDVAHTQGLPSSSDAAPSELENRFLDLQTYCPQHEARLFSVIPPCCPSNIVPGGRTILRHLKHSFCVALLHVFRNNFFTCFELLLSLPCGKTCSKHSMHYSYQKGRPT